MMLLIESFIRKPTFNTHSARQVVSLHILVLSSNNLNAQFLSLKYGHYLLIINYLF